MRVLFVGQNPPVRKRPNPARPPASLSRLFEWADVMRIERFSFTNASPEPGRFRRSAVDYEHLRRCCESHERVVALGREASRALDAVGVPHFHLPHPSGLNRVINDKALVRDLLRECRAYVSPDEGVCEDRDS